jgi:hypothetical protein
MTQLDAYAKTQACGSKQVNPHSAITLCFIMILAGWQQLSHDSTELLLP